MTEDQEHGNGQLPADEQGGIANSGKAKRFLMIGALVGVAYLGYAMWDAGAKEEKPKSDAEKQLEKIKAKQGAAADSLAAQQRSEQLKVKNEQAMGDPESMKLLDKVRAEKEAEIKAQKDAEDTAAMLVENLHYSRKVQLLPHDPAMAAKWESRMQQAQAAGKGVEVKKLTEQEEKLLQAKNPELWASLQKVRGMNTPKIQVVPAANPTIVKAPGAAGSGVQGQGGHQVPVPGSIDPRTGLPVSAGIPPAGEAPLVSGLKADGTPDIENGAYPITFSYIPLGEKNPVTVTQWVKPGYLTGRTRPYAPAEIQEADRQWRQSLKASTDVNEKEGSNVAIPYRVAPSKTHVGSGDFHFQQRYVAVQPNPAGVLTPPNPPVPAQQK